MRIVPALLAVLLSPPALSLPAPQDAAGALDLQVERAVIFKNGHALIVKRATGVVDAAGEVHTDELPPNVVLGTFWAWSPETPVIGMRSERVETRITKACTSTLELLKANVGKPLTLVREEERFSGTLQAVLEGQQPTALLRTTRNDVPTTLALPVHRIAWVEGADLESDLARDAQEGERDKRLSLQLGTERAGQKVELRLMYFTPDVRWIPTYRLQGPMEDSARLSLQGEVLNELEDLSGAELSLVVGVPHFRFRDTISPLSLEGTMQSALAQASPQLMGQFSASNGMFSNSFQSRAYERRPAEPAEVPDELSGEEGGDLYVFPIAPQRLPKGARITLALMDEEITLRHLHTLDLNVGHESGIRRYLWDRHQPRQPHESPLEIERSKIWHQLELCNESPHPWTTGAALVVQTSETGGLLPLGQDLLTYTPRGGHCELPVTVAVGVTSRHEEEEIGRQADALRWNRHDYTKIRKRGTLSLSNAKSEPVVLRIRLGTGGRVTSVSDEGSIKIDDFSWEDWSDRDNRWRVNQHSDLTWELELAPGEVKALTYEFEYYIY